ncbi:hypothetical protein [Oceanidesulfovibrio marinus]|uniref:hypothetical protein n=1 Tax=Oceanidesulfovibrio marinus TaxID=370038 RepID=UPI001ABF6C5C|nr:hypothetical protein [Oceanidesulfovibrio marinus]
MVYIEKSVEEYEAENAALRARLAELEQEVYRPCPVICMCGSTRFKQAWIDVKRILGCAGNIVIGVDLWGHHEHVYPDEQFKTFLDDLHKRKIDLADEVFVLDIDGYVGESTRSEIEYAKMIGRPVRYLSQEMPGYVEPEDPLVRLEQERNEAQARAERAETLLAKGVAEYDAMFAVGLIDYSEPEWVEGARELIEAAAALRGGGK